MNLVVVESVNGTEVSWNAFTSVNKFFVLARPNGFYLLTSTLDVVWTPTIAVA